MSYVFICSYLWGCSYIKGYDNVEVDCDLSHSWLVTVFAITPYYFRMAQCFRRFYDTRFKIHMINAGKYLSSILVLFAATAWRISERPAFMGIWIIVSIVAAAYTFSWDITQDWGLFRSVHRYSIKPRNSEEDYTLGTSRRRPKRYRFLREEISYSPIFYYGAIGVDLLLRLSFIFGFGLTQWLGFESTFVLYILAVLEILRRFLWNFIRLENEHLNNCGRFRASRDGKFEGSSNSTLHILYVSLIIFFIPFFGGEFKFLSNCLTNRYLDYSAFTFRSQ